MTTIADVLSGRAQWTVLEADCSEVLPMLPPKSIDHVITDPPYSEHTHAKQWIGAALTSDGAKRVKTAHKSLGFAHITEDEARIVSSALAAVTRRWIGVFTDLEGIHLWRTCFLAANVDYVRTCIWDKVDGAPQFTGDRPAAGAEAFVLAHPRGRKAWNGGGRRNIFRHPVNGERGAKPHPSTKPIALLLELLDLFTDPDDLVLDPFCGSGSLGIACTRLGRRYIGIDNGKDANGKPWAQWARDGIEAELRGLTRAAASAGQLGLFAGGA